MSDSNTRSSQRTIDYLAQMLQMNPVSQSEEIIALRTKVFHREAGLEKPKAVDAQAAFDQRRHLLVQLDDLRSSFWQMPLPDLQQRLAELDTAEFPEIQAALKRLHLVANHREGFPVMAQTRGFDGEVFGWIKKVLVAPARETSLLREQVLTTFQRREYNKRGRRTVRLLAKQMPEVYRLEADWFDALERQKVKATLGLPSVSFNWKSQWWIVGVGLYMLFKFLLRFERWQ